MAYLATGFTPEQEAEILSTNVNLRKFVEDSERTRMLIIAGTLAGFLYTLAQFGELAGRFRARRRSSGEGS